MHPRLISPLAALLTALMVAAGPAAAQEDPSGTSFITPFPPNDTYNLVMIGDDMGVMHAFQLDSGNELWGFLPRDALTNLAGSIEESGAEIVIEPLPAIAVDASQLVHVFQNLIGNALKFRRKDARAVVRISAKPEETAWRFFVADNGIGIEPKYFERIFQMFQRLHGRDQYDGTGIGLALCKKIVERHGGRIQVESQAGQGATFSFTIPHGAKPPEPVRGAA